MSIRSLKIEETINEKQKWRAEYVVHVEKRKAFEETVDHLYEWVDKLHIKLSEDKSSSLSSLSSSLSDEQFVIVP